MILFKKNYISNTEIFLLTLIMYYNLQFEHIFFISILIKSPD